MNVAPKSGRILHRQKICEPATDNERYSASIVDSDMRVYFNTFRKSTRSRGTYTILLWIFQNSDNQLSQRHNTSLIDTQRKMEIISHGRLSPRHIESHGARPNNHMGRRYNNWTQYLDNTRASQVITWTTHEPNNHMGRRDQ